MWKVASKIVSSRRTLVVFTLGFCIYCFVKSYHLILVSFGSGDKGLLMPRGSDGKSLLPSVEDNGVHSTLLSSYRIFSPNISFDAIFGNESCEADILGAPPFVHKYGCNDNECDTITCKRLLVGDEEAAAAAVRFTNKHPRKPLPEDELLRNTKNCDEFRKRGGYRDRPVRPSDSEFPIAFNILVHWHLEQFERLLRAIYRPQNVYCIHVDAKASRTFHSAVAAIAKCLDNVYVASRRQLIVYAGFSRLQVRTCFFQ